MKSAALRSTLGLAAALAVVEPTPRALAAAPALQLEEVTVTARRREERLRDVPLAVSVLDGARLEASGAVDLQQLSGMVPAVTYSSANPRNTAYTIRGLGSNTLSISAANDGIEPGVALYVDEVYQARPASAAFDFTDIERVEVLRGPQGTLYGKNAAAGAIHIISRRPSSTAGAEGELSLGGYGFVQAKGSVTGPLGASVAGRFAAQYTGRDGDIRNVRTGQALNAQGDLALRGQLEFQPQPALSVRLIADLASIDAACCTQVYLRTGESRRSPARQFPALAAGIGYAPPSLDAFDRVSDIDAPLHIDTRQGGLAVIAEAAVRDGRLTSVSAWRFWDWDVANDRDFTGLPIQLVQRIPSRQDQYSQELRFASERGGRVEHVAGLYAFSQRVTARPTSVYGPAAAYWLLNPSGFSAQIPADLLDGYGQAGTSRFDMQSYAAFGEIGAQATSTLRSTFGLRYTYEDKRGTYATQVSGGPVLSGAPTAIAELTRARLSILRPQAYEAADAGGNLSGRASLAWQPDPRLMSYVSYAVGFKSGGLNMSGLPLDAANQPALRTAVVRDERNATSELGLKVRSTTGRWSADLAVYRTVVEDYQSNIVSSVETAALRSYPSNIPQVRVQGMEADLAWTAASGLTLRLSAAYADGRYTDHPAGPCPLELQTATTTACDLTGVRLPGLSRWSGALGAGYRRALGGGELRVDLENRVRSARSGDASGSRYTTMDGYAVTDARIGYRGADGWGLEVFVRNLFDERYITAVTVQSGNSGLILGQPGDPRLFGVALRMRY